MSKLSDLKSAKSLKDLAPILGLPPSALAYTLFKTPVANKYSYFTIPKKSGGVRQISAPTPRLKSVQAYLKDLLIECRSDIESRYPKRRLISHGFRSEGSIMTNALQHRARRYVLNTDLENFFPSINFGRVRGYFISNRNFQLAPAVATVIAQIACHNNELPQGSPCSPILADLITHAFDMLVIKQMKRHKCTYSRYADDLTISTNQKGFPKEIAYQLEDGNSAWLAGTALLDVVHRSGFSLNHKKTRMQYRNSRQVVTSLVVNKKVNINSDYYRASRSMCHSLFSKGYFVRSFGSQNLLGPQPAGTQAQLEGILNHIYHVKSHEDGRQKLVPDYRVYHGIELLYRRFLWFKHFVNLEKPLILTEGKTDIIYLRTAINHLPKFAGVLTHTVGTTNEIALKFFKQNNVSRVMLGLAEGSDSFAEFIRHYEAMVAEYSFSPFLHPVIILIDNDSGADKIYGAMKKYNITVNYTTALPFYRIVRNLYLIKTPEALPAGVSQIEDLFDAATLATKIGNKVFSRAKDINVATEYSKAAFANEVVIPNASGINFSGFEDLLDRVIAAMSDHATRLAAGLV